jgi:hypothetical protein
MDIINDLNDFMETLSQDNSFAYLGFTGKIERPFQDKFAYYLYERYLHEKIVSKEYSDSRIKRTDLTILDNEGRPEIIIEFKASYAFNLVENKISYPVKKYILQDYQKHLNINNIKKYYVLLSANPYNIPEPTDIYTHIVAYYGDLKKFLGKNNPACFFEQAKDNIQKVFLSTPVNMIYSKKQKLGEAFGIENELYCFIFE